MARTYGRIETAAWRSSKLKGVGANAKLLWAYLIACPHGNAFGCFVLPMGYVAIDLELSPLEAEQAMAALLERGLVERDLEADLVRIVGWWGHNQVENGNVAKGISRALRALPRSRLTETVLKELGERYPTYFTTVPEPSRNGSETVSEHVGNQVEPPEPDTGTGNLIPEPESFSDAREEKTEDGKTEDDLALPSFLDRGPIKVSMQYVAGGAQRFDGVLPIATRLQV